MALFSWLSKHWNSFTDSAHHFDQPDVNPATGLPMVGDVDIQGNPFGTDILDCTHHDPCHDYGSWDHSCHNDLTHDYLCGSDPHDW